MQLFVRIQSRPDNELRFKEADILKDAVLHSDCEIS